MKLAERAAFLAVIGAGLLVMPASQPRTGEPQRESSPEFTSFSVTPEAICINFGVPVVTVSYTFDPHDWSNPATLCTKVKANGEPLHVTVNHQCLNDGTSGTLAFNLLDFFNNAPPSEITVTAQLNPSIAGDVYDTVQATVTAVNCDPPGTRPGGG